jgi:hypothetical protein
MAKILAKRLPVQTPRRGNPASDALRQSRGGSQGERLGALSWFVLCRAAKNEHQKSNRSARDEVAQYDRMASQTAKNLAPGVANSIKISLIFHQNLSTPLATDMKKSDILTMSDFFIISFFTHTHTPAP